ncbi:hypothetical protein DBR42_24030 [Pelomonas sp. HMWF004]|nr:hypothetical protein DBR42_24030 [Pelomonas sp. HMWF004]
MLLQAGLRFSVWPLSRLRGAADVSGCSEGVFMHWQAALFAEFRIGSADVFKESSSNLLRG